MRDYVRIPVGAEEDATRRDSFAKIDYFLQDLSRGMRRLSNGEVPDGSGTPIGDAKLSDLYFVLLGRPTNQVAHGGTSPSGKLTLSSTTDSTKGLIYLGEAETSVFDETNQRIGLATVSPTAKVHIKVPASVSRLLRPTADVANTGWVNQAGSSANVYQAVDEVVADDTDYVRHARNNGTLQLGLASCTDPGVDTGHKIWLRARVVTDSPNNNTDHFIVNLVQGVTTIVTANIPSSGDALGVGSSDPATADLSTSFTTYSFTIPTANASAITNYATLNLAIAYYTGFDPGSFIDISQVYFEVPPVGGGGSAETLQKWEDGTDSWQYDLGDDGTGNTIMVVTGTDTWRFKTPGLSFQIGSPSANDLWRSTDSSGTGAWGPVSAVLDADLNAIGALVGSGIAVRTAADTWALRALQAPASGLTITNPSGVAGNPTFALANDLSGLEALSTNGIAVRTATDTWTTRAIQAPASGITVTNPSGVAGDPTIGLANDLSAVEALGTTGIAVRTAVDTWATRGIAVPASGISITNASGIAGNPTLALANDLSAVEALSSTGIVRRTGTDAWSAGTTVTVDEGGTGITAGISGGVLSFIGTTTTSSSPALVSGEVVLGGGAGATPSTLAAGSQYDVLVRGATLPTWNKIDNNSISNRTRYQFWSVQEGFDWELGQPAQFSPSVSFFGTTPGFFAASWPGTVESSFLWQGVLPADYVSSVNWRVVYANSGTQASAVYWDFGVQYYTFAGGGTLDDAVTTAQYQVNALGTKWQPATAALSTANGVAGQFFRAWLTRDGGADPSSAAMLVLGLELAYTADM